MQELIKTDNEYRKVAMRNIYPNNQTKRVNVLGKLSLCGLKIACIFYSKVFCDYEY